MLIKKGFTLAEVLIVLGIIGVIAALTIPTLMGNSQDAIIKTRWKKAYSIVSQAYALAQNEEGPIAGKCGNAQCLSDLIQPYLKTMKDCNSGNINECWTTSYLFLDQPVFAAAASFDAFQATPEAANVISDGMVLGYQYISEDCNDTSKTGLADCGVITVDIDGAKGKHVTGQDLFAIHLQSTGIKPFGVEGDNYTNLCDDSDKRGCATNYLYGTKN